MLIITPDTVANRAALDTASLPKKFFGRVLVLPRRGGAGLWLRLIVEMQLLRYLVALLPFVFVAFANRDLAGPISQAPLAMLLVIAFVEMRVLRHTPDGRAALMVPDDAARLLDALAFRSRAALRRIAARRGIESGELRMVIEQSELARIAPLTFVSVQSADPKPHIVPLDAGDRAVIADTLFDAELTERDLMRANQHQEVFVRDIAQEARAVSAHARLAAALDKRQASGA